MLRFVPAQEENWTPESYLFPGVTRCEDVDEGARDAAWHVERAMRDVERRFVNLRRLLGDTGTDDGPRAA